MFCESFGLTELFNDPALKTNPQRVEARPRILPVVSEIFSKMGKQELMDRCEKLGMPFAPIAKPEDLFEDKHLNASGGLTPVTLNNGVKSKVPVLPIEMNGQRFVTRIDIPHVGEHTRDVLKSVGYSEAEVDKLVNGKVVTAG